MAKENTPVFSGSILRIVGFFFVLVLISYCVLPPVLNGWSASASAKQQTFLRPELWSADNIDPTDGNFTTVILRGTCDLIAHNYRSSSSPFEIAMCGHDLYFKRRWKSRFGGWFWNVEMAVTNFYSNITIKWRGYGSGGGGGRGYHAQQLSFPGQRMWSGTNFLGASTSSLISTNKLSGIEEFSDLKQFGPYLIPRTIQFVDDQQNQWVYKIEKVQFSNEPAASWFLETARKRFHYSPEDEKKAIAETPR